MTCQDSYASVTEQLDGLRQGVLLEVGFDTVAPNTPKDISSWLYDYAAGKVEIIDNRAAKAVPYYDPGYTSSRSSKPSKFRNQQALSLRCSHSQWWKPTV